MSENIRFSGILLLSLKDNNSSFTFKELPSNVQFSIGFFDDNYNVWNQTSSRAITGNKVVLMAK